MSTGKGKKRVRNQPVLYSELKQKHSVSLTATAWKKLQALAIDADLSTSEYLEKMIRAIDSD